MNRLEKNKYLASIDENTPKEFLHSHIIFSSDYKVLSKEKQYELWRYCRNHATHEFCLENLKQMRYALAELYFGE